MKKPDRTKQIGERIRERFLMVMDDILKNDKARTIGEFCEVIKCNQQQITHMRAGTRYATPEMIYNLCLYYNVNSNFLFPPFNKAMYLGKPNEKVIREKEIELQRTKNEIRHLKEV